MRQILRASDAIGDGHSLKVTTGRAVRLRGRDDAMTPDEVTDLVTSLLARHCGVEPAAIDSSMRLHEDIGLDSLDAAELLIVLEERTGNRFQMDEIGDLETVGAIIAKILASPVVLSGGAMRA